MAVKAKEKKKRLTPSALQARTAAQREAQRAARGKGAAQRARESKTATPAQARALETVQETAAPEQAAQRGGFRGGGAGRTQESALTRMQRQVTAQRRTRGALSGPGAGRDLAPEQARGPLWEAAKGMHLGFLGPEETWAERLLAGDRAGASANLRGAVYGAAGLGDAGGGRFVNRPYGTQETGRAPRSVSHTAPGPETAGQWLLGAAADALHDFGDRRETYGEKLRRGDLGGAALNFIGTGLRAPQNLFLNALSAAQDVAAGESPEYRYDMGGMEYLQRAEERSGQPGAYTWIQEQRGSENPLRQLLGNTAALGYELGTDPLSYLDAGAAWKGAQGRTPGTPTYSTNVSSGRTARDLARQVQQDIDAGWRDEEPEHRTEGIDLSPEDDIIIGRSVGAKGKNYEVLLPDGTVTEFAEGSRITGVQTIAGQGRDRAIDQISYLVETFGGVEESWQKQKGIGQVLLDGELYQAELHWYYEPSVGRVLFKVAASSDGNWKIW